MQLATIILAILQIILLLITACFIPVLNMWFENKLNLKLSELDKKYSSKDNHENLEKKIDKLTQSFDELNKWIIENLSNK